jgi:BirA family biotin operon repressor/biotin-[acetyl-CoA-carboxylase] ligase
MGVAVIKALNNHGIQGVGLKWPNDIYWQQKKLGGILVEVTGEVNGPCSAVIGLGLNLHLSSAEKNSNVSDCCSAHFKRVLPISTNKFINDES